MNQTVLIIEDETSLANNLAAALARGGVDSVIANSLAAASGRISSADYDLVCADIQLGDGSGLDFCEGMRRDRPDLPVIMMTGQDTTDNRLRSEGFGASAFIAKPFPLTRFRDMVAAMLREKQGNQLSAQAPRILMYSHDTIGLGHMRRNSAIAARIVEQNPRASVLMLVGSPSGIPFALSPGVDYVKLPSLTKVGRSLWRPQSLRVSPSDVISLRAALIEQTAVSFAPNLFLVDHEPSGVSDELIPTLKRLRAEKTEIVLGLRDILDDPEVTLKNWEVRGTNEIVKRLYDRIFVYGDESVFASRQVYHIEKLKPYNVSSCGYVTSVSSPHQGPATKPVRARIVVAGGGGRDAFPLLASTLEALASMASEERPDADIIAGPLMDAELLQPLEKASADIGARFMKSHPDIPALIAEADLFITMGGYNSIVEAISIGCPTLVVPRVGPSAEQRLRAECLAKRGAVEMISANDADAGRLSVAIKKTRPGAPRMTPSIDLGGADRAAALIGGLVEKNMLVRLADNKELKHAKA
jgi:predicted glycosyltransferase/CheY-like chemotaxis protein